MNNAPKNENLTIVEEVVELKSANIENQDVLIILNNAILQPEKDKRTIFVWNINEQVKELDLDQIFSDYGRIM